MPVGPRLKLLADCQQGIFGKRHAHELYCDGQFAGEAARQD
jgi:hypothetical protein